MDLGRVRDLFCWINRTAYSLVISETNSLTARKETLSGKHRTVPSNRALLFNLSAIKLFKLLSVILVTGELFKGFWVSYFAIKLLVITSKA